MSGLFSFGGKRGEEDTAPRKDRLTLSVSEPVKEAAKVYAERQGTSVSAMVEIFLGQLALSGSGERRMKPTKSELEGIKARIGSGEVKVVREGLPEGQAVAYLDSGDLVVDAAMPLSLDAIRARVAIRERGLPLHWEWLASTGDIADLHALATTGAVAPTPPLDPKVVAEQAFLDLLTVAANAGADQLHIATSADQAVVGMRVAGRLQPLSTLDSRIGRDILETAYVMGNSMPRHTLRNQFNSARLLPGRTRIPSRLASVELQFVPGVGDAMHLVSTLKHLQTEVPPPESLGLRPGQVSAVRAAAASRGGLFLVASAGAEQSCAATVRSFLGAHPLLGKGRAVGILVDNGFDGSMPDVIHAHGIREGGTHSLARLIDTAPDVLAITSRAVGDTWSDVVRALARGIQVWLVVDAADADRALHMAVEELSRDRARWAAGHYGITVVWQHALAVPQGEPDDDGKATPPRSLTVGEVLHMTAGSLYETRNIGSKLVHGVPLVEGGLMAARLAHELADARAVERSEVEAMFGKSGT